MGLVPVFGMSISVHAAVSDCVASMAIALSEVKERESDSSFLIS